MRSAPVLYREQVHPFNPVYLNKSTFIRNIAMPLVLNIVKEYLGKRLSQTTNTLNQVIV